MRFIHALFCTGLLTGPVISQAEQTSIDIGTALAGSAVGFEQALQLRAFEFPSDHGPHPSFRNEWWYLTGQLQDGSGRDYGFQYTLFRIGLTPPQSTDEDLWSRDTIWMAHVALSDVKEKKHWHSQRLSHGGVGSAGVTASPFSAWMDNWRLNATGDSGNFPWELHIADENFNLRLQVDNQKPPVLQGDRGLSQKGGAGNASFYYSYTEMQVAGTLDGKTVNGSAWLDREWSTSVLPPGVTGWDWFSLQLQDGRQLMLYQLRSEKNNAANNKSGSLVQTDGSSITLAADDISLQATRHWRSPISGARYPTAWKLKVKGLVEELTVTASFDEQELIGIVNYWEGVIEVESPNNTIRGRGYLEMTGYDRGSE